MSLFLRIHMQWKLTIHTSNKGYMALIVLGLSCLQRVTATHMILTYGIPAYLTNDIDQNILSQLHEQGILI